jgi:hypothetical protein
MNMKELKFPPHFQQYLWEIGNLCKTLNADPKTKINVFELSGFRKANILIIFSFMLIVAIFTWQKIPTH